MTSLRQLLNQENLLERENAVERLHSRWSSSVRVIVDRPPSQPLSRRQMSGGPSSGSVKQSHQKDPGVGDAHRRGNAFERLQQSDSKWTSGSGVSTDRPPLQPLRCRGSAARRLQESHSRWSSGSRATFDTKFARHRMLVGPSSVSALEHSVAMNNQYIFKTTMRALCTLTSLGEPQSPAASVTGTGNHCAARSA
jgi:hypothetical protein